MPQISFQPDGLPGLPGKPGLLLALLLAVLLHVVLLFCLSSGTPTVSRVPGLAFRLKLLRPALQDRVQVKPAPGVQVPVLAPAHPRWPGLRPALPRPASAPAVTAAALPADRPATPLTPKPALPEPLPVDKPLPGGRREQPNSTQPALPRGLRALDDDDLGQLAIADKVGIRSGSFLKTLRLALEQQFLDAARHGIGAPDELRCTFDLDWAGSGSRLANIACERAEYTGVIRAIVLPDRLPNPMQLGIGPVTVGVRASGGTKIAF